MKFNMAEIQTFLLQHVEKLVLGLAGLMVLGFLAMGYGETGVPTAPGELKSQVDMARSHVASSTWETEKANRRDKPDEFHITAGEQVKPIEAAAYELAIPLDPRLKSRREKRPDPTLYPAIELEARAGNGFLAVAPVGGELGGLAPARPDLGGLKANPVLPPNKIELLPGFRSPGGNFTAEGQRFVAVTALVPIKRQLDEYNDVFLMAEGYVAERDRPKYLSVNIERVEVPTADANLVWDRSNPLYTAYEMRTQMAAVRETWPPVPDPVDPRYIGDWVTFPAMPLMLRELDRFLLHSKVERFKPLDPGGVAPPPGPGVVDPSAPKGPIDPITGLPLAGGPGGPPRGPGLQPIGPRPGFGPRGEGGLGVPGVDPSAIPVDYQLLRFFDFNVEAGKSYRYRVQLYVEDPNDPLPVAAGGGAGAGGGREGAGAGPGLGAGNVAPPNSVLEDKVVQRIAKAIQQQAAGVRGRHWRLTDWSEPSPPARVPSDIAILAGSVVPPKDTALDRERRFKSGEPTGKLVVVEFVKGKARDLASEYEIGRGSQINFEADGRALNPLTYEIETIPHTFITQAVVLDLRGGDPLPNVRGGKEEVAAVAELLLMDEAGNLLVRDEALDFQRYQDSLLKVEKPREGQGPLNVPGGPLIPGGEGFGDLVPGLEGPRRPR